ncbi:helix-turn-helix domain-containing protein [Actinoalloteichus hymeniacidonis]|uniref:DNA binding protein with helix-turn-helix domain n=1 Tax=Actinoalloteichus hymeniacidonis TaxID=340345 RepID=A0AAC9HWV4_9PSEU|nr:helix-turn-helix transcriptional regulator [Actinoalloteichus hymeniacidonis]AOS65945.1 DNA binding protein with helix-turn-helix domain [Actinoalloteichus hymeniacidonis]MBB5905959.1 transcriptional regulator with XRE-family HTH domain [Actinoalloteichus hymeniacidonis]
MGHNSALDRRLLGGELRALREAAGRTHREVADHLDCSQGKISQIELGKVPVRTSDVRLMLELYQAPEDSLDRLRGLAAESKKTGWWQPYAKVMQPGFDTYIGLESAAQQVLAFHCDLVPALLQTHDYARSVLSDATGPTTTATANLLLAALEKRQERLIGSAPLDYSVLLDEATLHRIVGGPTVLRAQLEHLVLMSYRRNVTVRVLPYSAGAHPLVGDNVSLVSVPDPSAPNVVCLQNSASCTYLDKPGQVRRYAAAFARLDELALGAKDSSRMIAEVADRIPN